MAYQPEACVPREQVQYRMWNGVARRTDAMALRASPLRYELTLLAAQALGDEKNKTFGHIHNAPGESPGRSPTFPEIFEVLHGTAHFLFYTLERARAAARFCGMTEAVAGEQLVCPPDLFHLTINAGREPLLFADLISRRAYGVYDGVRSTRGAPWYELKTKDRVRNRQFPESSPLVSFSPPRLELAAPLYTAWVDNPPAFDWLDQPSAFHNKFPHAGIA